VIYYITPIIYSPTYGVLSKRSGKRKSKKDIPLAQDFLMLLNFLSGLKFSLFKKVYFSGYIWKSNPKSEL